MRIHLQYISEKLGARGKLELAYKTEILKKHKKLEVEVGPIRTVTLSDKYTGDKDVLVIDVWILPNGMYTGDLMRIVNNHEKPYTYSFE